MKTTLTENGTTEKVVEVEVERERYDRIFNEKVKKYSKEIRMNGFRPGNVPKQIVVGRFKEPIHRESLEDLVEEVIRDVCKEHQIEPVAPGRVEKLEEKAGEPIHIKAVLEVDPVIEVNDYKLNISVNPAPVADAQVEAELEGLRKRASEEKRVEREAREGDIVVAEYRNIIVNGEVQALPENRDFRVALSENLVPGMKEGLLGCKAGETRQVTAQFPENHPQANLAGHVHQYDLYIMEIDEPVPPALDDAFAKTAGFETLEELKKDIRASLEKVAFQQARDAAHEQAVGQLLARYNFEVPKARVQHYVKYKLEQAGHHHAEGEEHDHDHSDVEKEGVENIRRYRIIDEIAKKEKIKPTQEEVDERVRTMALRYGTDFETLKGYLRKNGRINDVREELRTEKTLDFIIGLEAPKSA